MEEISDYELIYMIRQKDETAFNMLFQRYQPLIWYKVYEFQKQYYEYLPDTSDTYNECMLTFHDIIYTYRLDKKTKFGTYLSTSIDFALKNYRRANARHTSRMMIIDDLERDKLMQLIPDSSKRYDPISYANSNILINIVYEVLSDMSEFERGIMCDILNGRTFSEIEKDKGVTRSKHRYVIVKFREKVLKMFEKIDYN